MGASMYPEMHSYLKGDMYKLILNLNHSDSAFVY